MQKNNKSIVIIVAAILVAAFFMPWIKYFVSLSGWDMIFGEAGQYIETNFKYLALIIPIAGGLIIYGAAFQEENYTVPKKLLFALPILTLLVIILTIAAKVNESGGKFRSSDLDNIMQVFGIGFWLTLIASIILPNLGSVATQASKKTSSVAFSAISKAGGLIMLIGIGLFIYSQAGDFKKTRSYDDYDSNKQLGLPDAFNMHMTHQESYIDKETKNKFMYFGIGALVLGFLVFSSGGNNLNTNRSQTLIPTPGATENPNSSVTSGNNERPQVNINLPKVDWNKGFNNLKNFLYKNKIPLSIAVVVLIGSFTVYNLFIKADPVKDGKLLAKNYCACSEELNKNNLTSMQSYHDEFDNKQFKSRLEARNAFNNILQENQTKYSNCIQAIDVKYKEKLADYNSSGGNNTYTFEQTYSSIIGACNGGSNSEVFAMQSKVADKIKKIIDPEPDIEKIKADLIGQNILGWNFTYVSEIKTATISNTTHSPDRIEYEIDLHMIGFSNTDDNYNDAQIIVTYIQNDGWYFNDVKEVYITYQYYIPSDSWVTINPLPGTRWSVGDDQKIFWKTCDWCSEILSGPDATGVMIPSSNSYLVKSREEHPIAIKFTYRPNN